jgi:uncharacterized Fe-S cluster-containing radical SAM superfamily protein
MTAWFDGVVCFDAIGCISFVAICANLREFAIWWRIPERRWRSMFEQSVPRSCDRVKKQGLRTP